MVLVRRAAARLRASAHPRHGVPSPPTAGVLAPHPRPRDMACTRCEAQRRTEMFARSRVCAQARAPPARATSLARPHRRGDGAPACAWRREELRPPLTGRRPRRSMSMARSMNMVEEVPSPRPRRGRWQYRTGGAPPQASTAGMVGGAHRVHACTRDARPPAAHSHRPAHAPTRHNLPHRTVCRRAGSRASSLICRLTSPIQSARAFFVHAHERRHVHSHVHAPMPIPMSMYAR